MALKETAATLPPTLSTSIHVVDVTQEDSVHDVATSIGAWDILVLGAGHVSTPSTIASANAKDFWQSFEVCVSCSYMGQAFNRPLEGWDTRC